jgi:hypothetical protein
VETPYRRSPATGALRQGEILTDVVQHVISLPTLGSAEPVVVQVDHAIAVIGSQDCDLEQDFNGREKGKVLLPTVLVFEAMPFLDFVAGLPPGETSRTVIIKNNNPRFQILEAIAATDDALGIGLPAIGLDFRRYFTIPTDELYKQMETMTARRRAVMDSPYAEHFLNRACAFLGRVGLPRDHDLTKTLDLKAALKLTPPSTT